MPRHDDRVVVALAAVLAVASVVGCRSSGPPARSARPTPPSSAKTSTSTPSGTSTAPPAQAVKPEAPVAPEKNPPGDIPDSQVFVPFVSKSGGFVVKVPEGWSRTEAASRASFTDKLNTIALTWAAASSAPTVDSVKAQDVKTLTATVPAFQLVSVKQVPLPSGKTVLLTYRQNSEPNPVTGKRYRLDVLRYTYFRSGKRVDLTLSSPVGADNVDPWRTVTTSFRWR